MKINAAGIDLIKLFEGCRLEAYLCPAGRWTIGYGHTEDVQKGHKLSQHQADVLLDYDLEKFEDGVTYLLRHAMVTDNQFSALVSFAFNLGITALAKSTLLRKLLKGDAEGAAAEFERFVYAAGHVLPGLQNRRKAERELFERLQ